MAFNRPRIIILISIDQLRWDSVGFLNPKSKLTPVMDLLAQKSVVFENAISQSNWTLSSHASLFTGLYPFRHRVETKYDKLSSSLPTIASILRENGFTTAAWTGGAYLNPNYGLLNGFSYLKYPFFIKFGLHMLKSVTERLDKNIKGVTSFIQANNSKKPFFLFMHTFETHAPYIPPAPFDCVSCNTCNGRKGGKIYKRCKEK